MAPIVQSNASNTLLESKLLSPSNGRKKISDLNVIGGGLAGCEAAWQATKYGLRVALYEMRPKRMTGAHQSSDLAELVCSNSLGSNFVNRAPGLLKEEIRRLGSFILECAESTSVPAGGALAVDRIAFSRMVTERILDNPAIELTRQEMTDIPQSLTIIATGPLTSERMSRSIQQLTGNNHLYFYDAIAPIIWRESINMEIAFRGSRYGRGDQEEGDYINCPMDHAAYDRFITELINAERAVLKEFEHKIDNGVSSVPNQFFESCLPVEVLASRGHHALAYGPMKPVGLIDPHTGRQPFAVLQLRQDNSQGTMFNMVGFQTNLKHNEQRRVFRMIPGLENAEFMRLGQMHRNTYIHSPEHLLQTLQFRRRNNLFFAGQITGMEGYVCSIATGLLAGLNAARLIKGLELIVLPGNTMLGALCNYITQSGRADFQPMKPNYGIMPPFEIRKKRSKQERGHEYLKRSMNSLKGYFERLGDDDAHSLLLSISKKSNSCKENYPI